MGRYVLISPLAHCYHHALAGRLPGSNFGGVLSIFDRMFGTYIEPDHRPETGIGYSTASNTNHDRPASISSGVSLSA